MRLENLIRLVEPKILVEAVRLLEPDWWIQTGGVRKEAARLVEEVRLFELKRILHPVKLASQGPASLWYL